MIMENEYKEIFKEWGRAVLSVLCAFALIALACVMCGCSATKYVPVETVRTEYRDRINTQYITDSVTNDRLVYIKGDTVYIRLWRDRWHTETKHDSIYIEKHDSVPVPYPVERIVEVERKRTWWESLRVNVGGIAIFLGLALGGGWLWRKFRK